MENLSEIIIKEKVPLTIQVRPYMLDHYSDGTAILPAVEAMEILARSAAILVPEIKIFSMTGAIFSKFLPLHRDTPALEAFNELEVFRDGSARARLVTRNMLKSGMTRTMEHAAVTFGITGGPSAPPPADIAAVLEGVAFPVKADDLYRDLVPFGPAYRNLRGDVLLSPDGALAWVYGGDHESDAWPLGSPFCLDAAFHAACAWSQRYRDIVAFPVGFARRTIVKTILPGQTYHSRIIPVDASGPELIFDIWIYDSNGALCESTQGLVMKDVSGGRIKAPSWARENLVDDKLPTISARCRDYSIIELSAVSDFAHLALSARERGRRERMGERRARSFIAARACCKRISRRLAGNDFTTAAENIETLDANLTRPICAGTGGKTLHCSVSHDSRFAFAAASAQRVGVDVERIFDRVLKGQRFYMTAAEQTLAAESALGRVEASLRVWSVKECVAKALDCGLVNAWKRTEVLDIGLNKSSVRVDDLRYSAFHDTVNDHLFTYLEVD